MMDTSSFRNEIKIISSKKKGHKNDVEKRKNICYVICRRVTSKIWRSATKHNLWL